MGHQGASGADEFGEMSEALQVCFFGAVDVEVVGVGGRDDGYVGLQAVEGAVVLVGLGHGPGRGGGEQQVAVVVAEYAAEEGVAAHAACVEHVGGHGRSGGLAVCAREAEGAGAAGDDAEGFGALDHAVAGAWRRGRGKRRARLRRGRRRSRKPRFRSRAGR